MSPVIPFGLVVVPAVVISAMSTQDVYQANPCLYILAFGMVAAKVTNKLVVSFNLSISLMVFLKALYFSKNIMLYQLMSMSEPTKISEFQLYSQYSMSVD